MKQIRFIDVPRHETFYFVASLERPLYKQTDDVGCLMTYDNCHISITFQIPAESMVWMEGT